MISAWHRSCGGAARKGWGPSIRDLPALTTGINRDTDWYTCKITFPTNFGVAATEFVRGLGGLDETYVGWGYEDVDFANRALAVGSIRYCRETVTAIHIDHLVHPEQERQAQANYRRFLARRVSDRTMPCISAGLFGIAGRFVKQLGPLRPSGQRPIERSLVAVKHFDLHESDCRYAATRIHEITAGHDLVGIAVYGSAATQAACRDVDLCVIVGHCRDTFTVDRMPSGKELELHLTCLPSICSQLSKVYFLGDNAYLIYFKFKGMRFLHDFRGLARRYMAECMRGDARVIPYMTSLYVGLADLAMEKLATADQLALGRYMAAIAMIGGRACPTREIVLSLDAARAWLTRELALIAPNYSRAAKRADSNEWLLYPPNFRGHALLEDAMSRCLNGSTTPATR